MSGNNNRQNQAQVLYEGILGVVVAVAVLVYLRYRNYLTHEQAAYLFASLLTVVLFVFIFFPVQEREEAVEKTRLAYLYERKDVVYDNLRDLNFEYKSGKFTAADFEAMRAGMEAEAARILAEIEQLEAAKA